MGLNHISAGKPGNGKLMNKRELAALYDWPRVIAVAGALGSGKTEWALDFSKALSSAGYQVVLADMDIINPYFCLRWISGSLETENLSVLSPAGEIGWGDFTYIDPKIRTQISDSSARTVIDAGGDAKGGAALRQFEPEIKAAGYYLQLVINPFRSHTRSIEEALAMKNGIEASSGLTISGVVANAHIGLETTAQECAMGTTLTLKFASRMGLPLLYALAEQSIAEETMSAMREEVPIWPLDRAILLPWEKRSEKNA